MTDTTTTPKQPTQASFLPMALTGMGSAGAGDKIGDAISQLVAWRMAVNCNCVPPDKVISAVHTICEGITVLFAFLIYYIFTKYNNRGA